MIKRRAQRRFPIGLTVLSLVVAVLVPIAAPAAPASAAIAGDFDPGSIISDSLFYDPGALTTTQVQQFLDARGASCVAGEQACLKDYRVATAPRAAEAGLCGALPGGASQSAAQIITDVASSCGVSPKVLLVLLEKEQSLVTRTRPTSTAYQKATGYGCPDTSACDSQYFGLSNQLYMAARQYQRYAANPTNWNHVAGRTNLIRFSPNASCGSSSVYIANQATAGLYNYTPYQPNAAALANLYGTGDGCSAYGNRNFWRLYTDWFGSTQNGSFLVRTPTSPAVYLVSGTSKYYVASYEMLAVLAPLGPVGYVSQEYLDRRTTGPTMRRAVLGPSSAVYLLDGGKKFQFSSCGQVASYGYSCADLIALDQPAIDALATGPMLTSVVRTTSGATFYVAGATKTEAADNESLTAAGMPTASVALSDDALSNLPYAPPATRPGIVLRDRATAALTLSEDGTFAKITENLRSATALSSLPVRPLDHPSFQLIGTTSELGAFVKDGSDGRVFFLSNLGKAHVLDAAVTPASVPTMAPSALALFADAPAIAAPIMIKGAQTKTIYLLRKGIRRPIPSWEALAALGGGPYTTLDDRIVALMPSGPAQLGPGTLVKSADSTALYLVDGYDKRVKLNSFDVSGELGIASYSTVAADAVNAYTATPSPLTIRLTCNGADLLGVSGKAYDFTLATAYPQLPSTAVDALTCAQMPRASGPLARFLRTDDGSIYYVQDGQKRHIYSWASYIALGGATAETLQVTTYFAGLIPNGPPL